MLSAIMSIMVICHDPLARVLGMIVFTSLHGESRLLCFFQPGTGKNRKEVPGSLFRDVQKSHTK